MKRLGAVALMAFLVMASSLSHAWDITGLKDTVNTAGKRAEAAGDSIARSFSEQALRIIDAWEKANSNLVNVAFDRLDAKTQEMFNEIRNLATRIEQGEAVAFMDIQTTMLNAGTVIEKLPWSSKETSVAFYSPRLLIPSENQPVEVRILGSRLSASEPKISLNGHPIEVRKVTDNELRFTVDRASLASAPNTPKTTRFVLTYESDRSHWYNPVSWLSDSMERDIELTMLPSIPGSVTVTEDMERWERKKLGPYALGAKGKDSTYRTGYTLTPREQEDGWIVDKVAQEDLAGKLFTTDKGNGGSSCTGFDLGTFTDKFVGFKIQLGHQTENFHKSDAIQHCNIWVMVKKRVAGDKPKITKKPLSWLSDTPFDFDRDRKSHEVDMTLYTGRTYHIRSRDQVPHALFDVLEDKRGLIFRPRLQREF